MNDFERDLRNRLHGLDLPAAPQTLVRTMESVTLTPVRRRRGRRAPFLLLGVAALLVTSGMLMPHRGDDATRRRSTVEPPVAAVVPSPYPFPDEIAGRHVYSVSELLEERAAGHIEGGPILLSGYWSPQFFGHSCRAPDSQPGELEIYCHDKEYGITERNEFAMTLLDPSGRVQPASGPVITPWIPNDIGLAAQLGPRELIHGQPFPPIPIVVRGHLDDLRAAECRQAAIQLCRDRFVIDEILALPVDEVATPGITPTPSPFPFESPPPLPLDLDTCRSVAGDAEFSFVGWMSGADLTQLLDDDLGLADQTLAVAITRDPVKLADRREHRKHYRLMGRSVCFLREWEESGAQFSEVKGSLYRLYDDGTVVPTDSPYR
jgi:hypothetical protein